MPGESRPGDPASEKLTGVRAWFDVENPPQVQYLLPLAKTFAERGAEIYITARDSGITFALLAERDVAFSPVGQHYGPSKREKVLGTLRRTYDLRRSISNNERPDCLISASRSASLAARSLGIPSFVLCDYEYVSLQAFRLAGSYVVHPDAISAEAFRARGASPRRLISYRGIKEDITFARTDVEDTAPYVFPGLEESGKTKVLFRPPAEESHYHREESGELGRAALERLAEDDTIVVIFSPRYEWQVAAVGALEWKVSPVVLEAAVASVPLLKGVDVVISGGGTMTREAAYLGIPAVSLFRGRPGGVDQYLEATGRLTIVRSVHDLSRLDLRARKPLAPLYTNRAAASDVADAIARRIRVPVV
jgi:uncharacterized protein